MRVATTDTTAPPVVPTVVQVNDAPGGALRIEFPGRHLTGNPPAIALPSGDVRFVIHSSAGGHVLRIDGVPGFEVDLNRAGETVTRDVHLDPGPVRHVLRDSRTPRHGRAVLLEVPAP